MSEDKDSRSKRTDKAVAPEEERPKRTRTKVADKSSATTRKSSRSKSKEEPVSTPSEEIKTISPKRTRAKKAEDVTSASATTEVSKKAPVVTKSEAPTRTRKTVKRAAPEKKVSAKPQGEITRAVIIQSRLWRLRLALRRKQPAFRHDQAHRWLRVPQSWRKVRGNDNDARRRCRGKIPLVSPGYRKPVITRDLHPSGYMEVLVSRPADLTDLNPQIHAVRIAGNVGAKKRQDIVKRAESLSLRVLNHGISKRAKEEELFTGLESLEETEVETK